MCDKVSITQIPGRWVPYTSIIPPEDANETNGKEVYNRLIPKLLYSPKLNEKINIIVPVMPAVWPTMIIEKTSKGLAPIKGNKSPYSETVFEANRSGTRSAVVPTTLIHGKNEKSLTNNENDNYIPVALNYPNPILIRLKGCGMWLQENQIEFPCYTINQTTTEHYNGTDKVYEIRGVAFTNTALTELYASKIFSECFNQIGFLCGNEPLGCWIYDKVDNDIVPDIEKCVVVMKTYGDKRCETHLLSGLEQIISGIKEEDAKIISDHLMSVFESHNIIKPILENKVYNRVSELNYSDIPNIITNKVKNNIKKCADFNYVKQIKDNKKFIDSELIRKAVKDIKFVSNETEYSLSSLIDLYCQIGREAGISIAGVHRCGFLWGSYCEHQLSEFHCNSHPDNLIILNNKDYINKKQLLAPVDFDMSFEYRCTVNFWHEQHGIPDSSMATDNIFAELKFMLMDLLGYAAMVKGASTAIKTREQPKGESRNNIIETCRLVLAWEYFMAYNEPLKKDFEDVYKLVQKSLEYTEKNNS